MFWSDVYQKKGDLEVILGTISGGLGPWVSRKENRPPVVFYEKRYSQ